MPWMLVSLFWFYSTKGKGVSDVYPETNSILCPWKGRPSQRPKKEGLTVYQPPPFSEARNMWVSGRVFLSSDGGLLHLLWNIHHPNRLTKLKPKFLIGCTPNTLGAHVSRQKKTLDFRLPVVVVVSVTHELLGGSSHDGRKWLITMVIVVVP